MGFCTDEEYWIFLRAWPGFRDDAHAFGHYPDQILVLVSDKNRNAVSRSGSRTTKNMEDKPDGCVVSRQKWVEYSKAKDEMFSLYGYEGIALVRCECRRQAPRPPELYQPPF